MICTLRLACLWLGLVAPLSAQVPSWQNLTGEHELIAPLAAILGAALAVMALFSFRKRQSVALERALKETQERLQWAQMTQGLILENSAVGIAFVKNRIFQWVNPYFSLILGQSQETLKGASTRIIYNSEEEFRAIGESMMEPLSRGSRYSFEILSKRADGRPFCAAITGKALDPSRPNEGSIWIFEDLTARKEAAEALRFSEAKFLAVFEAAPAGLALIRERHFIRVNSATSIRNVRQRQLGMCIGRSRFQRQG
jgi:PAS domain S-box-containing protein